MNNQYKTSLFCSAARLISVLLAIPGLLFPLSLLLFLKMLSTNFGCANPYQWFSKGYLKLRWYTRPYGPFSVHSHRSSNFDFSMFNCFARLHPKKGKVGEYEIILMVVSHSWIHNSALSSLLSVHLVSPGPNAKRSRVAAQLSWAGSNSLQGCASLWKLG